MSDTFNFKSFAGLGTDSQAPGESPSSQNTKPPAFGSVKTGANFPNATRGAASTTAAPFGGNAFTTALFAALGPTAAAAAAAAAIGKSAGENAAPASAATTSGLSFKVSSANPLPKPTTTDFSAMFKLGAAAGTLNQFVWLTHDVRAV